MSKIENKNIKCKICKKSFFMPVYKSINVTHSPELKQKFFDEELNKKNCPECGMEYLMDIPVLYHDTQNKVMMYILPKSFLNDEEYYVNKYTQILERQKKIMKKMLQEDFDKYSFDIFFGVAVPRLLELVKLHVKNKTSTLKTDSLLCCKFCRNKVDGDSNFCEFCGANIKSNQNLDNMNEDMSRDVFEVKDETKWEKLKKSIKKNVDVILIVFGFGMFGYGIMWYITIGSKLIRRFYGTGEYDIFYIFIAISIMMIVSGILIMYKKSTK